MLHKIQETELLTDLPAQQQEMVTGGRRYDDDYDSYHGRDNDDYGYGRRYPHRYRRRYPGHHRYY
jgi:hypothetical protein